MLQPDTGVPLLDSGVVSVNKQGRVFSFPSLNASSLPETRHACTCVCTRVLSFCPSWRSPPPPINLQILLIIKALMHLGCSLQGPRMERRVLTRACARACRGTPPHKGLLSTLSCPISSPRPFLLSAPAHLLSSQVDDVRRERRRRAAALLSRPPRFPQQSRWRLVDSSHLCCPLLVSNHRNYFQFIHRPGLNYSSRTGFAILARTRSSSGGYEIH